jgi:LysM repeat protein
MNRSFASNRGTPVRHWVVLTLTFVLAFIMIAQPQTSSVQAATCAVNHTVKSGETLSSLALQYATTVEAIAEANDLTPPYTILIDQVLCIPASSGTSTGTADTGTTSSTDNTASTSGPYFTVTFDGNLVSVKTVGYPKNNTYYVNLFNGTMTSFYRLGLLSTRPNTTLQQTYQLPKEFRGARSLIFCLKNVSLDNIQCKTYNSQPDGYAPGFTWTIRYTSAK